MSESKERVNATFEVKLWALLLVFSKSPTPIPASWRESPFEKSNNQKKDHRTDRGNNDRIDHPAANVDTQ
jgi:hypothetical protein